MRKTIFALFLTIATHTSRAGEITVSAAASLTDAFTEIAKAYEKQYPLDKIHLNFASSGALLQQILNGAPADVFASADQLRMNKAAEAGLLLENSRRNFAGNALVVIVPTTQAKNYPDLPTFIADKTIAQLAIANPEHVPAGRYSKNALEKMGLWEAAMTKATPAQNVRQALDYVARGEVDGGFVYQTDAALMKDKVRVVLQVPLDEPLTYPIAVLNTTQEEKAALNFVDFVSSEKGKEILQHYGFTEAQ